jgi:hypothetical protein
VKGHDDASDSVTHVSSDSRSTRDDEEGTYQAAQAIPGPSDLQYDKMISPLKIGL